MSKKRSIPEATVIDQVPAPFYTSGWVLGIGATIAVVAVFAGVTAVLQQRPSAPLRLPPEEMKSSAAAKPTPAPWTYDSVTNQHWDPTHKHWHSGHPPNQGHAGEAPKTAPDIANPAAWQYDAASNQHFNPDHNHWHNGQPPADKTAAPAPTPEAPAPPIAVEVTPAPATEPVAVEEAIEVPAQPVPAPEPAPAP